MTLSNSVLSIDALDLHLLLATSAQNNILLQLEEGNSYKKVIQRIRAFFTAPSIGRTLQIVPADVALSSSDADIDDVLVHFFIQTGDGLAGQGKGIPQVLMIPYMEDYQQHLQIALKAVLRAKRFDLKGQTYNLPDDFLLIGITADRERIAGFLLNVFGLFLELDRSPTSSATSSIPPIIPLLPKGYYTPQLRVYAADLLGALRHHPLVNNTLLTADCDFQHLFKMATLATRLQTLDTSLLKAGGDSNEVYKKHIDLTPSDIADVLSTCVLHRLRTRLPEERWDSFWNKQPKTEEAQQLDDAIRNGARLRYESIIAEVLHKV